MTENRDAQAPSYSAAEIGALAHLYRGEMYRSTVWRTRLDTTTNWAVVTTGIALSVTFSSVQATPAGRPHLVPARRLPSVRGSPLSVFRYLEHASARDRVMFL
jgi:hypothetical protein